MINLAHANLAKNHFKTSALLAICSADSRLCWLINYFPFQYMCKKIACIYHVVYADIGPDTTIVYTSQLRCLHAEVCIGTL